MAGTYDVKAQSTNSSVLGELTYFSDSKQSGALQKNGFANLIRHLGDLIANRINIF